MNALLICPADRREVAYLARFVPLVLVPILGRSLLEHWLEYLAVIGVTNVWILAADRPEQIRDEVRDGARWGLKIEVLPQMRELTVEEARSRFQRPDGSGRFSSPENVILLDHLPHAPHTQLFRSYADWFAGLQAALLHIPEPGRIGARQVRPGVWIGRWTTVARDADLRSPCWLGENVRVESRAIVGPNTIVEDGAHIEHATRISSSVVGRSTFVGAFIEATDSLAAENTVINWRTNSVEIVSEQFLLCSLGTTHSRKHFRPPWWSRCIAAFALFFTLPWAIVAIFRARWLGEEIFRMIEAVRPCVSEDLNSPETFIYYEMAEADRLTRRWPQLWSIIRGDLCWVGNRPLRRELVDQLQTEYERMWLAAPAGFVSLADANGCGDVLTDEAQAHGSFYAATANVTADLRIFVRALLILSSGRSRDAHYQNESRAPFISQSNVVYSPKIL